MRVAAKRRGLERILLYVSFRENPISVGFPSFAPCGAKFTLSCVFYTVKEKIRFPKKTMVKSIINTYQFCSSFSFLFAYFLFSKRKSRFRRLRTAGREDAFGGVAPRPHDLFEKKVDQKLLTKLSGGGVLSKTSCKAFCVAFCEIDIIRLII